MPFIAIFLMRTYEWKSEMFSFQLLIEFRYVTYYSIGFATHLVTKNFQWPRFGILLW